SGNQSYCDKSSASKVEITSIHTLSETIINHSSRRLWERRQWLLTMPDFPVAEIPHTTNGHRDWVLK
ncbi:TPA: hypothetical protein ACWCA0_004636, partial [Escherichia coli]